MEFEIDCIRYNLKEPQDFSWLNEYGKVFSCIDKTGSGCICFGVKKDSKKYFIKVAGAKTLSSYLVEEESIDLLKRAVDNHKNIKHPNLIELIDSFEKNEFFVAIYEWVDGECLFDHWNFDLYNENPNLIPPAEKFKSLSLNKKLDVIDKLFTFFITVTKSGYATVDFYDSSIMYNFNTNEVYFCDIDMFKKIPFTNTYGTQYPGTKRLKAPEHNEMNALIDEKSNQFTLGAIIFDMLSEKDEANIKRRYTEGHFIPNSKEKFMADNTLYNLLIKATSLDKNNRFNSIEEFYNNWQTCLNNCVYKNLSKRI